MQALSQLSYTPLQNRNEILEANLRFVNTLCAIACDFFRKSHANPLNANANALKPTLFRYGSRQHRGRTASTRYRWKAYAWSPPPADALAWPVAASSACARRAWPSTPQRSLP